MKFLQAGHELVILDNLSNSDGDVIQKISEITGKTPVFVEWDITDVSVLKNIFETYSLEGVIHFAGLKSVWVSCDDPFSYYQNNIFGTINLLKMMDTYDVRKMIFSSSATVYDALHDQAPFSETSRTGHTTNPYGTTKFVIEQILSDMCTWKQMDITALRYFNPIGAHSSGLLGEDPSDIPTNLLPVMMQVSDGSRDELTIFGDDYDTPDGTCIRDYIHVVDLADAHMQAREQLAQGYEVYNVGTWTGTSVQEMVQHMETITQKAFPHTVAPRRNGDIAVSVADVSKIQQKLWWTATLSVEQGIQDALRKLW